MPACIAKMDAKIKPTRSVRGICAFALKIKGLEYPSILMRGVLLLKIEWWLPIQPILWGM